MEVCFARETNNMFLPEVVVSSIIRGVVKYGILFCHWSVYLPRRDISLRTR